MVINRTGLLPPEMLSCNNGLRFTCTPIAQQQLTCVLYNGKPFEAEGNRRMNSEQSYILC